jgi:hypothetical protein
VRAFGISASTRNRARESRSRPGLALVAPLVAARPLPDAVERRARGRRRPLYSIDAQRPSAQVAVRARRLRVVERAGRPQ